MVVLSRELDAHVANESRGSMTRTHYVSTRVVKETNETGLWTESREREGRPHPVPHNVRRMVHLNFKYIRLGNMRVICCQLTSHKVDFAVGVEMKRTPSRRYRLHCDWRLLLVITSRKHRKYDEIIPSPQICSVDYGARRDGVGTPDTPACGPNFHFCVMWFFKKLKKI